MLYSAKLHVRDYWNWIPLCLALVIQALIWFLFITGIRGEDQIFLHYNIIFGVDLVGNWWQIYFLPIAGLAVLVINYFLSLLFYGRDKFLARLLMFWIFFFHIFLLIGAELLVRLNV